MPRIIKMDRASFSRQYPIKIVKKANLPKNVLRISESKSFTLYGKGAQNYLVAKPGCKLVWE